MLAHTDWCQSTTRARREWCKVPVFRSLQGSPPTVLASACWSVWHDARVRMMSTMAAMSYSIAHATGHLIGARDELAIDGTLTPFSYGHGYANGIKWRVLRVAELSGRGANPRPGPCLSAHCACKTRGKAGSPGAHRSWGCA